MRSYVTVYLWEDCTQCMLGLCTTILDAMTSAEDGGAT